MRFATVAPANFLRQALSRRGMRAREPRFDETGSWRPAYEFMRDELARLRAAGSPGQLKKRWPLWLWPTSARQRVLCELKSELFRRPGTPAMALIVDLPRGWALLSRYDLWHSCLNNWPVHLSEADCDAWLENETSAEPVAEIGAGWRWIFPSAVPASAQPASSVEWLGDLSKDECQAVAWSVAADQVRGAWILSPGRRLIRLGPRAARQKLRESNKPRAARGRAEKHQQMLRARSPFARGDHS